MPVHTRASNRGTASLTMNHWRPGPDRPLVHNCTDVRVGPHNRCQHPTAITPGYRPCAGDPGCPYRLPADRPDTVCPWHHELAAAYDRHSEYRDIALAAAGGGGPQ